MTKSAKRKPTRTEVFIAFQPFYTALTALVDELLSRSNVLYQSSSLDHYTTDNSGRIIFNKRYRAVLQSNEDNFEAYQAEIDAVTALYYQAVARVDDDYNPDKKPPLPIYIPQITDHANLTKLQLHINKAHSSVNYKKDDVLPVASEATDTKQPSADIQAYRAQLEELGYNPSLQHTKNKITLNVDVASVCEDCHCDSLQLRSHTGNQIRASFFSTDENGMLTKSQMHSVGILIVPHGVDVYHSHPRSRRTDAIYVENHPREIVFDFIEEKYRTGRVYKVSK